MEKIPLEGSSKDKISLLIDSLPNECNTTLVHSDLINPSNTIIAGTKRLSHIDWEWSLIGDPAWEFADI
jgi:thiamine kinase-like enzyme